MSEPSKQLPLPLPSFEEQLYAWRKQRFCEMEFTSVSAGALARKGIDYHKVAQMLDQGCTTDLAVKIFL